MNIELTTAEVIARAKSSAHLVKPFDEEIIDFLDCLSKKLFEDSRSTPSLAPLAFFIRKAHSKQLRSEFMSRIPQNCVAVPQGMLFHIPPTNVDTLFLYTLAISLLAGNSNIVRISYNAGPDTYQILNILFKILEGFPIASSLVTVVTFGREIETLSAISSASDMRMIWGGDTSIKAIREAPIGVHAKDLAFPDRFSFSIIEAKKWNSLGPDAKISVIDDLYNDTYWFDQMACSSPQQLVIVDKDLDIAKTVCYEMLEMLNSIAKSKYTNPEGQAINKMVAMVNAMSLGSTGGNWNSNSLVSVSGISLTNSEALRPGAGFFSTQVVKELSSIANQIQRNSQTVSYLGFDKEKLIEFATSLNGKGVDRFVPIGKALDFSPIWDGKDLLLEMHRLVSIS